MFHGDTSATTDSMRATPSAASARDKFNGGSSNYDGFGRNASANDSTYLLLWLSF